MALATVRKLSPFTGEAQEDALPPCSFDKMLLRQVPPQPDSAHQGSGHFGMADED